MKKKPLSAQEVAAHFRTLDATPAQLRFINESAFDEEYIVVTRGRQAIEDYICYQRGHGRSWEKNIHRSDRIGHCTHCHHEFILPLVWQIDAKKPGGWEKEKHTCPECGCKCDLISAYRGMRNKTLRRYVTCFESSKKDPDVILGKGIMAIRTIEDDYKTCRTVTYTVTMYYFKQGETPAMYKRRAWYSTYEHAVVPYMSFYSGARTGEDGIGTPWVPQKRISDLATEYINRGYSPRVDGAGAMRMTKKRAWKYCQLDKFIKPLQRHNGIFAHKYLRYFAEYTKYPKQLEMIMKMNLRCVAEDKVLEQGTTKWIINWQASDPKKVWRCRLTKADKAYIKANSVSTDDLTIYSLVQQHGQQITLQEAAELHNSIYDWHKLTQIKQLPNIRKLLKYGEKQETLYEDVKKSTVVHDYFDYLHECEYLQYNLADKTIAWPKDFMKAHIAASNLCRIRQKEIIAQQKKMWEQSLALKIQKRLETLSKYRFETDIFFIRPAESAEELIREGAENHTCVGNYIERYASGRTNILFIRRKDSPDVPFFTVEVIGDRIIQCRTKNNQCAEKGSDVDEFVHLFEEIKLQKPQTGETA